MSRRPALPADTAAGDKLTVTPFSLTRPAHGVVVTVPSHRRFAVVEFDLDGRGMRRRFRECVFLSQK